jgi:hypothetical protein
VTPSRPPTRRRSTCFHTIIIDLEKQAWMLSAETDDDAS